jgi:uncharacterized alkaline shock family protein YloU
VSDTVHQGTAVPRARGQEGGKSLASSRGTTTIGDNVVAKIAALAAREVSGVSELGAGGARALGTVRGMVGAGKGAAQGVSVEVGERQAAVDIDVVVDYGIAIPDLAASVRRNVISAVERMCGLEVTEVNIRVDDVNMPGDDRQERQDMRQEEPRVQ